MRAPALLLEELAAIRGHAVRDWPHEACGFVLRRQQASEMPESMVMPCGNIAEELHVKDPATHPRGASEAYVVAPAALKTLAKRLANGWMLAAIYHSHTLHEGARFSDDDVRGALLATGEPAYPTAMQVVISLPDGRPEAVNAYQWDTERQAYVLAAAADYDGVALRQFPFLPLVETAA